VLKAHFAAKIEKLPAFDCLACMFFKSHASELAIKRYVRIQNLFGETDMPDKVD